VLDWADENIPAADCMSPQGYLWGDVGVALAGIRSAHFTHIPVDGDTPPDLAGQQAHRRVPAVRALRFPPLVERDPSAAARIQVTIHEGVSHLGESQHERIDVNALSWLSASP
jgi:hypothetical protein